MNNTTRRSTHWLLTALLGALLSATACTQQASAVPQRELDYQRIADRIRLKQLRELAELIERFEDKTGYYPLTKREGAQLPVKVAITRDVGKGPATNASAEELERELSAGLGEKITLERDPQVHDLEGYRRYHYQSDGSTYEVYVYLYFETPLTEKVGDTMYRFTLVPNPGPAPKIAAITKDERAWLAQMDEIRIKDAEKAKAKKQ